MDMSDNLIPCPHLLTESAAHAPAFKHGVKRQNKQNVKIL